MSITAVLFDLDDTLFDHWACTRAALGALRRRQPEFERWPFETLEAEHSALLESLHLEVLAGRLTVDDARRLRFASLLALAGAPATEAAADLTARVYRDAYVAHWRTVPGALELLTALRGRAALGIVTNNVASEQRLKMTATGIDRLVDAVVISEDVGVTKPDPRIFEIALERLGRSRDETVMVGDAWRTDIDGARAAGLAAVWFNRFAALSPDPTVREIRSLEPASAVAARILSV